MKPKTKFIKIFNKLPDNAKQELIYHDKDNWNNPRSLAVCFNEIRNDTKLGKKILKDLGFSDT